MSDWNDEFVNLYWNSVGTNLFEFHRRYCSVHVCGIQPGSLVVGYFSLNDPDFDVGPGVPVYYQVFILLTWELKKNLLFPPSIMFYV